MSNDLSEDTSEGDARALFWRVVNSKLDALRLTPDERKRIERALSKKVALPAKHEKPKRGKK